MMEFKKDLPTLISFSICPFVQRAAIVLLEKDQPFERVDIDLSNKPDWFTSVSPLGKVPVLVVDGETPLFESSVINEYLDESFGEPLLTGSALEKAYQRAWIAYSETLIFQQYSALTESDSEVYSNKLNEFRKALLRMPLPETGQFFSGDDFTLVDASIAPLFMRLKWMPGFWDASGFDPESHKNLHAWVRKILDRPSISASVSDHFEQDFIHYFNAQESAALAA